MELKYLESMKEHNLKISDLPEDAQTGIQSINDVLKGVGLLEKKGKTIGDKTLKKIKAMDKWVCYEILDLVNDADNNEDEIPHDSDEVLTEAEQAAMGVETEDEEQGDVEMGIKIDAELKALVESGKKSITLDELKNTCKNAYAVIFKTYDDSGDNGIVTSHYELIETDDELFTITKK